MELDSHFFQDWGGKGVSRVGSLVVYGKTKREISKSHLS